MNLRKCVKLDKTEETKLLKEYMVTKSQKIRDRIFEAYYPLVKKIAYNVYKNSNKTKIELDDLLAEGTAGLLVSIDKYNPEKSDHLYPVAYLWIKEYVHCGIMKNLSMMGNMSTNSSLRILYHRFRKVAFQELGYDLPLNDTQRLAIAEKLKVKVSHVVFFEKSFYEDIADISEFEDYNTCGLNMDQNMDVDTQLDIKNMLAIINEDVVPSLTERERYVLNQRILKEESADSVANNLGSTKSTVYIIEKKLLSKISDVCRVKLVGN